MTHPQSHGAQWERILAYWHRRYRRDELAWIIHCHPRVKRIKELGKGRFIGAADRAGPPDFAGAIDGGRSVVFDAKSTTRTRWPLSDLAAHQAKHLEAAHRRGACAFVLLRMGATAYLLPWSALGPAYWRWAEGNAKRGEASLTAEDCEQMGIAIDAHPASAGWLEAVT